jgi:peroxiredoxin
MLRSFYTSFYPAAVLAGFFVSLLHFLNDPDSIGRFAAFVSFFIGVIWWVYVFTLRLRNAVFASLLVTVATATSLLITIGSRYVAGTGSLLGVRLALTALVLWLLYHLFNSKFKPVNAGLTTGSAFPDTVLYDQEGHEFRLSAIPEKKMVVFYRGKWCPFCVDQLCEFSEALPAFEALNTKVFAVFIDPIDHAALAQQTVLYDRGGALGKQLGIHAPHGLPLGLSIFGFTTAQNEPLAVLIDENMRIISLRKPKDNRQRPTPSWFLRYLR